MRIKRKPGFDPMILFGKRQNVIPGEKQIFFHYGRSAIYHIFRSLRLKRDDTVLFPAYICDTALQPLIDLDITFEFYKLDPFLNIDLSDVSKKLSPKTKVLFIVHYFGFPQPVEQIRDFCRTNGLILIEDCAHVLPDLKTHDTMSSTQPGKAIEHADADNQNPKQMHESAQSAETLFNGEKSLGSFGDFSMYSLKKYFSIPGAGILLANNFHERILPFEQIPPKNSVIVKNLMYDFIKFGKFKTLLFPVLRLRDFLRGAEGATKSALQSHQQNLAIYALGMHRISWKLVQGINFEYAEEMRRRNFNYLLENLKASKKLKVLFEKLPYNVVPMGFPIYAQEAREICEKIKKTDAFLWPRLHPSVVQSDDSACIQAKDYSSKIFLLPLHEDLRKNHLDFICDSIEKIVNE